MEAFSSPESYVRYFPVHYIDNSGSVFNSWWTRVGEPFHGYYNKWEAEKYAKDECSECAREIKDGRNHSGRHAIQTVEFVLEPFAWEEIR